MLSLPPLFLSPSNSLIINNARSVGGRGFRNKMNGNKYRMGKSKFLSKQNQLEYLNGFLHFEISFSNFPGRVLKFSGK